MPFEPIFAVGIACPKCGRTDNVHLYGSGYEGKKRFRCYYCDYRFIDPSLRERKYRNVGDTKQPSQHKPRTLKQERSAEYQRVRNEKRITLRARIIEHVPEVPIVIEKHPLPSVDNLLGVPCFGCEFSERIGTCDPIKCAKLDRMLGLYEFQIMKVIHK